MGCSSSREALGGVVSLPAAWAERRQDLRSRSLPTRMCRGGGHDGVAYTTLPAEESALTSGEGAPAAVVASLEDAVSATSSWTALWRSAEPAPSLQPAALDLDPAILPGSGQPVDVPPSPSHPSLLYPEKENPAPPPPEKTCEIDMGTPAAARDIPEVTSFVELHEKMEKKAAAAEDEAAAPGFAVAAGDVTPPPPSKLRPPPPRTVKGAVVVYFTSLRGVRRTFEDCRAVRAILRCYGVRLDERDVSMHAAFKSELRALLLLAAGSGGGGEGGFEGRPAPLPRVFVVGGGVLRGDLGGAEEVRALHEAGELAGALAGCDAAPGAGRPGHAGACAACGGEARFVPCGTCHGSRKVFVDDEVCRRFAGFFRQCPDCNENGLIRCPVCSY
ncbi:unnamed protein product [Urochloa decumbens]|uniref:Glutaredoxin domain-containing protein n=1 Tax=Urochloa decumbens TaxID=240449 RepID=A0ABC9BLQ0_9POAL